MDHGGGGGGYHIQYIYIYIQVCTYVSVEYAAPGKLSVRSRCFWPRRPSSDATASLPP